MKMIIDGKKVDSLSGETFGVINPATGKVIESVPKATAEDIDLAVTAAVKGQKEWAKTSVTQRADILHRFVEIVEQNKEMLAQTLCAENGNADMVYEFASTSKVTFPGAGVAVMATSEANLAYLVPLINIQTIGYDKINQLRHVKYLQNKAHTLALMQRHAAILRPKFHAVLDALDSEIAPLGIGGWKRPVGGYFVSYDAMPGTAKRALALCKEAGVTMTGAGATFPYGVDPQDSNIRIAPSLPPVEELQQAIAIFCLCVKLAALEKLGV